MHLRPCTVRDALGQLQATEPAHNLALLHEGIELEPSSTLRGCGVAFGACGTIWAVGLSSQCAAVEARVRELLAQGLVLLREARALRVGAPLGRLDGAHG